MKPNLSPAREFLASHPLRHFIDGEWLPSRDGSTIGSQDPGDGEIIAEIAGGGAADVDAAVSAAQAAFARPGWSRIPANERAVILHRLADLVDKHAASLAEIESLNVGKIRSAASGDVQQLARTIRHYADLSVAIRRREAVPVSGFDAYQVRVPYGPCAFILPWNFPLLLLGWNIAPALAAGNTVVIKPSEEASL